MKTNKLQSVELGKLGDDSHLLGVTFPRGYSAPPGFGVDLRGLDDKEVIAMGCLTFVLVAVYSFGGVERFIQEDVGRLHEYAEAFQILGINDVHSERFNDFLPRRCHVAAETARPWIARILEAHHILVTEREARLAAREAARAARLAARTQAPADVPSARLCSACGKRPPHFDDLCKRCANERGVRPHGKVA